jgi:hypothetical protein
LIITCGAEEKRIVADKQTTQKPKTNVPTCSTISPLLDHFPDTMIPSYTIVATHILVVSSTRYQIAPRTIPMFLDCNIDHLGDNQGSFEHWFCWLSGRSEGWFVRFPGKFNGLVIARKYSTIGLPLGASNIMLGEVTSAEPGICCLRYSGRNEQRQSWSKVADAHHFVVVSEFYHIYIPPHPTE